jgi:hypothetical protein
MMTQELEVSILAAPLGAIDRRSLSQAWYTALRLAPGGRKAPDDFASDRRTRQPAVSGQPRAANVVPQRAGAQPFPIRAAVHKQSAIADVCRNALHRQALRPPLARRIERAFADPNSRARRATFSLGRGNARVHVILQSKGDRTVLLAICPPEARDVVSRALAQARRALAARGIGLELPRDGGRRCS